MQNILRIPLGTSLAVFGLVVVALSGCTSPALPNLQPTVEEVPFLRQQLTQEQITQWQDKMAERRQIAESRHAAEKKACYQHFFVNRCLTESRRNFLREDHVLRKQELELNRQERALKEIDRKLRIQQQTEEAAARSGTLAPSR